MGNEKECKIYKEIVKVSKLGKHKKKNSKFICTGAAA